MATKNYLSLAGLTTYDGLIKEYIGTEDAKSIKSLTVSGNTVSFFKTEDASGTAAYTVNLPDVSGFMDKIASASGDKVVKSNSDGSVSETDIGIDELITGYYHDDVSYGDIMVYNGDGQISDSGLSYEELATEDYVDSNLNLKTVYIVDNGATSDYARVYSIYQGIGGVYDPIAAEKLIDINIPKDQVVEDGSVVDITFSNNKLWDGNVDVTTLIVGSGTPTAADAGKYIKLELQNVTDPLYIAAQSLVDIYTAQQSAAQVQLVIDSNNEISASIVAGSIGTTELAGSAVTTAKIADDAVTADKVAISAHTEAQTAGADGLAISVTTTDGQVSGVSGSIAANTYDAYGSASAAETAANGYTDSAIAALDATKSQTAGADGLALSITEVDGKITSISGSIAANTYDASGAAATAKSEVIGASGDAASASTIYGAKAYADAATDAIATADIQALFE